MLSLSISSGGEMANVTSGCVGTLFELVRGGFYRAFLATTRREGRREKGYVGCLIF